MTLMTLLYLLLLEPFEYPTHDNESTQPPVPALSAAFDDWDETLPDLGSPTTTASETSDEITDLFAGLDFVEVCLTPPPPPSSPTDLPYIPSMKDVDFDNDTLLALLLHQQQQQQQQQN
jgi:hypothetical protein